MGVFKTAQERLHPIYGALQPWDSGNGVRCTNELKGRVTLYSKNIASGNLAELAFEIPTMAARAGETEESARALVEEMKKATGQDVNIDPVWRWPRVGLSKKEHVDLVVDKLSAYFKLA